MATTPHTTPATPPSLKRVPPRQYSPRPVFWYDPGSVLLHQSHPQQHVWSLMPYADTLRGALTVVSQWCHANKMREAIIYLTGGHDAASTQSADYYREPLEDGWRISSWRTGPMAVTYEFMGVRVHVRVAAAWFDEASSDTANVGNAHVVYMADEYALLQGILRRHFGSGAYLLGTPAQTGLDLLEQSLPYGLELPPLPTELRERIQHNSPQGRNEVLTAPDGPNAGIDTLDSLVCYDAKFMYAACISHVPAGPYVHLHDGMAHENFHLDPWVVGFYRVFATVPEDWHHIGLLPTWEPEEQKTLYPWQPGQDFESWCTGAELQLAADNGWDFTITEAIIWPDAQKLNPLRTWHDKLLKCREWAEAEKHPLLATALRHILIDALGALARRSVPEHHVTPLDQISTIPHSAYNRDEKPWGIEWDIDRTLAGWAARFQHPEIPAMVWGRARARLAKFGLSLPVDMLVLARTDAWWVTAQLNMDYVGLAHLKPGEWRQKEYLSGPLDAPRDVSDALLLMRRARGKAATDGQE